MTATTICPIGIHYLILSIVSIVLTILFVLCGWLPLFCTIPAMIFSIMVTTKLVIYITFNKCTLCYTWIKVVKCQIKNVYYNKAINLFNVFNIINALKIYVIANCNVGVLMKCFFVDIGSMCWCTRWPRSCSLSLPYCTWFQHLWRSWLDFSCQYV